MHTETPHSRSSMPFPDRRNACRRREDLKLLQRERELDAARRICQVLFQHTKVVDELVVKVLQTALDVVGAEAGSVLLADPATKQLVFRYVIGEKAALLEGTAFPWNEGIAGAVFSSGEPAVISDVSQDQRHFATIDLRIGYKTRDLISLPLKRWDGDPIGVLEVLNKREGRMDEDDVAILTIVSALSAQTIEQARLFEEAKMAEVVRLLGDISHDIRNMLQPVVAGAELLRTELNEHFSSLPESEATHARTTHSLCDEMISRVGDNTRRIQDRVQQIADCVKGLSGPPHFEPCQIVNIVESVFQALQVFATAKHISLRSEGLDSLPTVQADERRLFNAFYNLVNNAIPEVPLGGSITIRGAVDLGPGIVTLSVADTGRGMPPEVRDSLFTARAISRKPGGTGLGTKIVKDVVDAHGGRITVESEVEKGTTFYLTLPIEGPAIHTRGRLSSSVR